MSATVQVHGWKAVVILVMFGTVWGYRQWSSRKELDTEAINAIRPWIVAQYMSAALHETKNIPLETLSPQEREAMSEKLLASGKVEIKSIEAHGFTDNTIVRVEVLVDGQPPPDGKSVRYYRMKYSMLLGWTYDREVDAVSYWLALW